MKEGEEDERSRMKTRSDVTFGCTRAVHDLSNSEQGDSAM